MYSCISDNQNFHCQQATIFRPMMMESRWNKSQIETAPNCPRCASSNTKFCYYNNYSFSQPRYFCKGCRRYWTKGGSLRNVPVGGGCRKSRRARSSSSRISDHQRSTDSRVSNNNDLVRKVSDSSTTTDGDGGGANIDLAAVFAKFLNQDTSKSNNNNNVSSSSSSDDLILQTSYEVIENDQFELDELYMFQSQSQPSQQMMDQSSDFNIADMCGNNNSLDELEAILGDIHHEEEVVPWTEASCHDDIGWSNNNLSNIGGPQLMEFQDFALFSLEEEDEDKMASQLLPDDQWNSSFDLSVYEIFTSP